MRGRRYYKQPMTICAFLVTSVFVLLRCLMPRGVSDTFDLSHMRYSGLDINRFSRRLTSLKTVCASVDKGTVNFPQTLLYSKGLNSLYCPVPFAYSTWFKHTMLQVESKPLQLKSRYNLSAAHAIHSEALVLNLKPALLFLPEALAHGSQHTVIIARDPWQRLIAAYNGLVKERKRYKTQCSEFVDSFTIELRFAGFLRCILHYANRGDKLQYLDKKLSPIHTLCSVCRVPYTYIVKYEDLGPDLYDFIATTKPDAKAKFLQLYYQARIPKDLSESSVDAIINALDRDLVSHVQKLYALDFKLFSYDLR